MISVRPDPVRYIDQLDADTGPADDADKVQVETLKRPGPAPHLSVQGSRSGDIQVVFKPIFRRHRSVSREGGKKNYCYNSSQ